MGFGLEIEFTDHLQIVTTSNYSAIANSHTLQFTTASTKPSQSAAFLPVIAWSQLSMVDVSLTLGSPTVPMPQLPASKSDSSQ
jgi:hypothetical protein